MNIHNKNWAQYEYSYNLANSRENWAQKKNSQSGEAAGARLLVKLYAKIIAESELLQPALNEIHKFCFQHWSRGRGTCGTGSGAPAQCNYLNRSLLRCSVFVFGLKSCVSYWPQL